MERGVTGETWTFCSLRVFTCMHNINTRVKGVLMPVWFSNCAQLWAVGLKILLVVTS